MNKKPPELKPLLAERMQKLLPDKSDYQEFLEILKKPTQNWIRCNTLKTSPDDLLKRLTKKGWKIEQPFRDYPEIMIVKGKFVDDKKSDVNGNLNNNNLSNEIPPAKNNKMDNKKVVSYINAEDKSTGYHEQLMDLEPGELGRSLEHLLGYYYVQEIASMLSVLVLNPMPGEVVLDLCAAPGSKTTQIAAAMKNEGAIIANDVNLGRIKILATNLERCGVANTVVTRKQGFELCKKLKQHGFFFDKILVDAPCSGEGTLRSSQATAKMWRIKSVKNLSNIQKSLLSSAVEVLKPGGELVYSTCTHAPEENEEVIDFVLKKFSNLKVESINLPLKCRKGLTKWDGKSYDKSMEKSCRIYPQDNDTEGFFVCKIKKLK